METRNDGHLCLVKEKTYKKEVCASTPSEVADFFINNIKLKYAAEEYVYILALNTRCNIIGVFEISHGTIDASICSPREIFIRLLLCGAKQFIFVHNHPSGYTEPSTSDKSTCKQLSESGKILNVPMVDFLIVGKKNYVSFAEKGYIE